MIYHTCVRCGLTDANVLDLDTGGAYHPELRGCISMLRDRLAAVEAERDAEKQRRREIDNEAFVYAEQVEVMRRRAGRAERTLAALREPSEAVVRAAQQTWDGDYCHMGVAIRAAVAAAEKEVQGE